jgi:NADPH:quinone reductase-like Zn-dependent oxidoreductase
MKAVTFAEYGDPDVLQVTEVPEPEAGPGQVRIQVRASGLNPLDWKVRRGAMAQFMPVEFPAVDGREAAGVVDQVGEGADAAVGDEVFGLGRQTAAEYAVLGGWAAKPATASWEQAAGLPVAVETSVRAFTLIGLQSGQTVLVNGAAGGVGAVAVQIAVARGAKVIGTASERNHEFLRGLGAEPTTYGDGLADRVRALGGVDVVFDTAGQGVEELIALTGDPKRVVTIAGFAAASLGVIVTSGGETPPGPALAEGAALVEAGRLTLPVAQVYPFARAADAHRESEAGHVRGKLILVP